MPTASGTYVGDHAGILPDNSATIMHMADQFSAYNRQKEIQKSQQAAADQKRAEGYYKLIGESFDLSKFNDLNPYHEQTVKDLTATSNEYVQMISEANRKGVTVDEGQLRAGIQSRLSRIKSNDDRAKLMAQQIKEAAGAFAKDPNIDSEKLVGLAMKDYFYSTDPVTGEVKMNPKAWDPNKTGVDAITSTMEKYPVLISSGDGTNDVMEEMKKAEPVEYKIPAKLDYDGQTISPGFDLKIKPYQEVVYDKNGLPTKLDIRQEPVLLPNGDPVLNPDGSPKRTIAKDLKERALSHTGFALRVKADLHQALGEENQRRQAINENLIKQGLPPTLPMIDGDSEEAKVMHSDIILKKVQGLAGGGEVDQKENKDFENRMKLEAGKRADQSLGIAQARLRLAKEKAAKGEDVEDVEDFVPALDEKYGVDVEVEDSPGTPEQASPWYKPWGKSKPGTPASYKTVRIIPTTADQYDLEIFVGKKDAAGVRTTQPQEFKRKDGTIIKGWQYDPATGNAKGKGNTIIDKNSVQREYLTKIKEGVRKLVPKTKTGPTIQGLKVGELD